MSGSDVYNLSVSVIGILRVTTRKLVMKLALRSLCVLYRMYSGLRLRGIGDLVRRLGILVCIRR